MKLPWNKSVFRLYSIHTNMSTDVFSKTSSCKLEFLWTFSWYHSTWWLYDVFLRLQGLPCLSQCYRSGDESWVQICLSANIPWCLVKSVSINLLPLTGDVRISNCFCSSLGVDSRAFQIKVDAIWPRWMSKKYGKILTLVVIPKTQCWNGRHTSTSAQKESISVIGMQLDTSRAN